MTGTAPERSDLAIARVLAGGLADTADAIARDLVALLNRATGCGTAVLPVVDAGDGRYDVLYSVEGCVGAQRSNWTIEYDTATGRWLAAHD